MMYDIYTVSHRANFMTSLSTGFVVMFWQFRKLQMPKTVVFDHPVCDTRWWTGRQWLQV